MDDQDYSVLGIKPLCDMFAMVCKDFQSEDRRRETIIDKFTPISDASILDLLKAMNIVFNKREIRQYGKQWKGSKYIRHLLIDKCGLQISQIITMRNPTKLRNITKIQQFMLSLIAKKDNSKGEKDSATQAIKIFLHAYFEKFLA